MLYKCIFKDESSDFNITFDLYSTSQETCIGKLCTAVCYACFYMALNAANISYSFSSLHDFQENVIFVVTLRYNFFGNSIIKR